MTLARLTEVQRATERLIGILSGIAIDGTVTDDEIVALSKWLNLHPFFHHDQPFKTVVDTVNRILEDGYIDDDERDEILELCHIFDKQSLIPRFTTDAIRRLHGVLNGIVADEKIRDQEIYGLQSWLEIHGHVKDYWPFCELWKILGAVLSDLIIDDREKMQLMNYCKNFCETPIKDAVIHDEIYARGFMATVSCVLKPFTDLCDRENAIEFDDRTFCFTGPARTGPRSLLHEIAKSAGGIPKTSVSFNLNYLVVGAQSSPCWAYSTYGRKIESVMNYRTKGGQTAILHEDDFVEQANVNHTD